MCDLCVLNVCVIKHHIETLSDLFHEVKDFNRGDKEKVGTVMRIETMLEQQTAGLYKPDTTYNIK